MYQNKRQYPKIFTAYNDFKEHGYDAYKIIDEYLKSLFLKLMINTNEANIRTLSEQITSLNNSLLSLESQVSTHKQTMDIYYELEGMRFGFKELKQLWHAIYEIAEANKISSKEAISKFLKDIENQYDYKLGFKTKVKNNKVTRDSILFRLQPSIGPTLSNLIQKGITEYDIIDINRLVELFTNNNTGHVDSIPDPSNNQYENNKNNTIGGLEIIIDQSTGSI